VLVEQDRVRLAVTLTLPPVEQTQCLPQLLQLVEATVPKTLEHVMDSAAAQAAVVVLILPPNHMVVQEQLDKETMAVEMATFVVQDIQQVVVADLVEQVVMPQATQPQVKVDWEQLQLFPEVQ
jgi:hypothetical protein